MIDMIELEKRLHSINYDFNCNDENMIKFSNGLNMVLDGKHTKQLNLISNLEEIAEKTTEDELHEILDQFFYNDFNIYNRTYKYNEEINIDIVKINHIEIVDKYNFLVNCNISTHFKGLINFELCQYNTFTFNKDAVINIKERNIVKDDKFNIYIDEMMIRYNNTLISYTPKDIIEIIENNNFEDAYMLYQIFSIGSNQCSYNSFKKIYEIVDSQKR